MSKHLYWKQYELGSLPGSFRWDWEVEVVSALVEGLGRESSSEEVGESFGFSPAEDLILIPTFSASTWRSIGT